MGKGLGRNIRMKSSLIPTVLFLLASSSQTWSEGKVVGEWKTTSGEISSIERCNSGYCIIARSGQYAGQKVGTFAQSQDSYVGKITDPRNKVTYSGKITVLGNSLKLRGCATNVLCKTQTWNRANP